MGKSNIARVFIRGLPALDDAYKFIILSRDRVAVDGVWIGNRIY
jgi:hypothetical protein